MNKTIIILLSLLTVGCIPLAVGKQIIPIDLLEVPKNVEVKEVNIKVKVKKNEKSLESAIVDLNNIYGPPIIEINALRDEDGKIIIMKKLYYQINERIFTVVSIVNDRILLIDTVHNPDR